MPGQKKPRGRPVRTMPPKVDATPDELATLLVRKPPGPAWPWAKCISAGHVSGWGGVSRDALPRRQVRGVPHSPGH